MSVSNQKCLSKRNKKNISMHMEDEEDRISKLPDCVLHHILSFLPTKRAAVTSVLSKRWGQIWTTIPTLDFTEWRGYRKCSSFTEALMFEDFVERVLLLREHDSSIQKFRLLFDEDCNPYRASSWLSYLIKHKIQELDLKFDEGDYIEFPRSLFFSETLAVFKLEMSCDFDLPSSIYLPSLKILSLKHVAFVNDHSTEQLFSNCPVLDELYLFACKWEKVKIIKISTPVLTKLKLSIWSESPSNWKIDINAPSLRRLVFRGDLPKEFGLCNLPAVTRACIDVTIDGKHVDERNVDVRQLEMKFLRPLSNVQVLTLSGDFAETLFHDEDSSSHFGAFRNLTRLKLSRGRRPFDNSTLLNMLQILPNLEHLVLFKQPLPEHCNEGCAVIAKMPECLSSHLKDVVFREFDGCPIDLDRIEFLLKNSLVLERMLINYFYPLSSNLKKRTEVTEQLLKIPKYSAKCLLEFTGGEDHDDDFDFDFGDDFDFSDDLDFGDDLDEDYDDDDDDNGDEDDH